MKSPGCGARRVPLKLALGVDAHRREEGHAGMHVAAVEAQFAGGEDEIIARVAKAIADSARRWSRRWSRPPARHARRWCPE